MSGGYGDDDDGDMFDSVDEESDESELSADETENEPAPSPSSPPIKSGVFKTPNRRGRQLRVKPMSPKMRAKYPRVVSMMLTDETGRQLMFVRN